LAKVAKGYSVMRQRRVVIAGLARNVADVLPQTIGRIERLGELFADYRVVIYENDSSDDTPRLLRQWSRANPRVTILNETHHDPVHRPSRNLARARRMAYYRSCCQELILARYRGYDNVVLVDTDLEGGWSYDGIANTFGHDDWDFVGSFGVIYRRDRLAPNQIAQYDAWAFREDEEFTPISTAIVNSIVFERGEPLQPVSSCFGGLGVYRMPAYAAGAYDGSDVEHVTFHRRIRQMGFTETFLNPSQITLYGRRRRSMDRAAMRVLGFLERITGRRPTIWYFPSPEIAAKPTRRQRQAA
jgi:hypothetical protein